MKKSTWSRDLLVMLAALCVAGVAVVWVLEVCGKVVKPWLARRVAS